MYKPKLGGNKLRNAGKRKYSKTKDVFIMHIRNNIKQYSIVMLLFLIGLILGIIFVNNSSQAQIEEITTYLGEFINSLKTNAQIDKASLLKEALISNFLLALSLWFVGSTVVGMPIVYAIITYRGFCLGYTISSVIASLGIGKRNYFCYDIHTTSKYNIYTSSACISSKWDEVI